MKSKFLKAIYLLVIVIIGYSLINIGNFGPMKRNPVDLSKAGDTVSVLSVGQANSALISSGGKYCLIDGGSTPDGDTDAVTYLSNAGITEIDLLVISHFHTDHTSDISEVIKNFKINKIVIPNLSQSNMPTTVWFENFISLIEGKDISVSPAVKGDRYAVGNGVLEIVDDTYNDLSINDTSIATLFRQGEFTFLNTADGEREYEERLVTAFGEKVTLFTAGHHGSSTSNTDEFIKAIKPSFVAISAGKDNEYGHPHRQVTERFENMHIPYAITFRDGTIVYSITEDKLLTAVNADKK